MQNFLYDIVEINNAYFDKKMGYKILTKGIKKILKYQDNYEQFTSSLVQTNIFVKSSIFHVEIFANNRESHREKESMSLVHESHSSD